MVLQNLEQMADISIYLQEDTTEIQRNDLIVTLRKTEGIKDINFISKEQALEYFEEDDDIRIMLEALGENPLPESIDLVLEKEFRDRESIDELVKTISENKIVEDIYSRSKVTEVVSFVKSAGLFLFIVLLVITVLIIANTIRLTVYSKQREIEIRRLVGATEFFVRLPFVIEGCIKGLASVVLTILLMFMMRVFLVAGLKLPGGQTVVFLGLFDFLVIVIIGIAIGGVSSLFAVKRFFSR